jgi:MFS family permease
VTATTETTQATNRRGRGALWSANRRMTTAGLLLLVTLVAFEALSVGTAMPTMVAALHGQALYSWPFTAFLAASVVGTVLSGRVGDARGPRLPLLGGPALFAAGLLVAGAAPNIQVLLAGRVLQGLGAGVEIVAIYVLIALVYPERDRPAAFGAVSAAWVLPALIGPTVAGLLTQHAGWRWIFLGLAPFVLLGVLLLIPLVRRLPAHGVDATAGVSRRRGIVPAALAAAIGLSALTWAAQHPQLSTAALALGGLVLLVPALRVVLPRGTLRAARGLPTVVLCRGLATGAFFGVEAYVPLTLTTVHGASPAMAGLPLTIGALGWSAASTWQGRHPEYPRDRLLRLGFLLLAVGVAGTTVTAFAAAPYWLVLPVWAIAAAGMGLGMPSIAVRLLELSPPAERGFNSAALQIWDMLLSAACIGFGGVLLAMIASTAAPAPAVVTLDPLMAAVALLGAFLASRTNPRTTRSAEPDRDA